ncbi:DUF3422 domain-containing protein [Asticcacaulis sp. AND118]|uniref:DUF3422 domain-containing protein n=1 Tax=Asticcacaulis sp. AND118 TaxID=2840468 RepID=UPI001CFFF419|nr:DUF3422 domain-containing protein [Asticcacaulis sp. AND118]UDF05441.1 DUF3422 domain-containing protein [Asticcacaulis sp. AND118]
MTQIADHPLRLALSELMHERALPVLAAPLALRSWVLLVDDADRAAETEWVNRLGDGAEGRLARIEAQAGRIWERHGEFSTWLSYTSDPAALQAAADRLWFCVLRTEAFDWLSGAPGQVFRSVEIAVDRHAPDMDSLGRCLDLSTCVSCDAFDGRAQIWTDFRAHDNGAGRIFIHDKGLRNDELSRLLQTLIEIGHYRKLALLGFPEARAILTWLKGAEQRLVDMTRQLNRPGASQDDIYDSLTALSADVEQRINEVGFRLGATEAYARLVEDRLISLRERPVEGFSTMKAFIERRLQPAMRTCEAASARLNDVSDRIGRVSDLLRAKVSISLETQNQLLLKNMNARAELQVKLSELVEGLSVFALSYYIINLIKYVLEPVVGHSKGVTAGYSLGVIVVLVGAWQFIRRRKRKLRVE